MLRLPPLFKEDGSGGHGTVTQSIGCREWRDRRRVHEQFGSR
jgi:hypothetical protein